MEFMNLIKAYYIVISLIIITIILIRTMIIIMYFENNKKIKRIEELLEDSRVNQEAILRVLTEIKNKDYNHKDDV